MDSKSLFEWIGVFSSILGVLAIVVGLTRYLVLMERKHAEAREKQAKDEIESQLQSLQSQNSQLHESIRLAGQLGPVALSLKDKLDSGLQRLMATIGATGGSIYVPVETKGGTTIGLSFMTIEPFNRQNRLLKSKIIPLRSMAGQCFTSGKSTLITQMGPNSPVFEGATKVSGYKPVSTINIPVLEFQNTIGVVQLLRKEGEQPFSETDLTSAQALSAPLGETLTELRKYPAIAGALSEDTARESFDCTVLVMDISASSTLFREFPTSFALQLLNEFFEQICEIGFRYGGQLDNYMGDGALMRFGSRPSAEGHELAAVKAALAMVEEFPTVRHYWSELNPALSDLHFRAGLSAGSLFEGPIGHSLVRNLGVVGLPISVATSLCDAAPRNRNAIYIDGVIADRLHDEVSIQAVKVNQDSKLASNADRVFELVGLANPKAL